MPKEMSDLGVKFAKLFLVYVNVTLFKTIKRQTLKNNIIITSMCIISGGEMPN